MDVRGVDERAQLRWSAGEKVVRGDAGSGGGGSEAGFQIVQELAFSFGFVVWALCVFGGVASVFFYGRFGLDDASACGSVKNGAGDFFARRGDRAEEASKFDLDFFRVVEAFKEMRASAVSASERKEPVAGVGVGVVFRERLPLVSGGGGLPEDDTAGDAIARRGESGCFRAGGNAQGEGVEANDILIRRLQPLVAHIRQVGGSQI